jgi:hypothetical protein
MTISIQLSEEKSALLGARAKAVGLSTEQYAQELLEKGLQEQSPASARPISEVIEEIMSDVPPEEFAKLPKDGASEHDHYIYGWPKRHA